MYIYIGCSWNLVMDNVVNGRNVKTSSGDVGRKKD
jgi:hypothetical protein